MNSVVTSFKVRELFPLGKGGMGTTYLGCARGAGGFERLIAIKRLHDHLQQDAEACTRLLSEAELAGCVHHANVVAVQHVDRDSRGAFLVLDYVEGGSMKELQRSAAPETIPQGVALRLMLDCLAGLAAIHSATDHQGHPLLILHRDISPENILVGLDGMARLTDFGIARSSYRPSLTAPSQLVGKLGFMAPEYIDRGNLGPPLDIYSLGVTLWMLLTGKNPWQGLEEAQLLAVLLTQGVPEMPPETPVSPELRQIVKTACAMNPEDRYASALEMALALERSGAPVSEHFEVATYVGMKFEHSTSERRLEAAQLLTIESNPPPPGSSEDGGTGDVLQSLPPIAPATGLSSLFPLLVENSGPQYPLAVPGEGVRTQLTPGGANRSSEPGNGDLLSHEISPREQRRSRGGRTFAGIVAAVLLLSVGSLGLTGVLKGNGGAQEVPSQVTSANDSSATHSSAAALAGPSSASPDSSAQVEESEEIPGNQVASSPESSASVNRKPQAVDPPRSVQNASAADVQPAEAVPPPDVQPKTPQADLAVSRRSPPAGRESSPSEIVSRNPYLK